VRGDVGDVAEITALFTNDAFAATDPDEATLTVQEPDGTQTVYVWPTPGVGEQALEKDSTGTFHADHALTQSGIVTYRRQGTGAVAAVDEGFILVRQSMLTEASP
jgi:hypothetical protein